MSIISKDIAKAVELLAADELVAIPTETVYGLAGNAFSENAIRKIFEMKKRPFFNPLIVHIASPDRLQDIARTVPEKAQLLANAFWPGPLTLVLPKKDSVPDIVTAGKPTVAIRVPNHPVTLELLEKLLFPLAAPSANPFGSISPTTAQHVAGYFADTLKMVLDGGACTKGIESTIVGFENSTPVAYRLGSLTLEEIESVAGPVTLLNKKDEAPDAPGMLSRHYAPSTPTVLAESIDEAIAMYPGKRIGVISIGPGNFFSGITSHIILSETGDLQEAAARLYAAMHELDEMGLDVIIAQRFPDEGIGRSLNDRLQRAAKGSE